MTIIRVLFRGYTEIRSEPTRPVEIEISTRGIRVFGVRRGFCLLSTTTYYYILLLMTMYYFVLLMYYYPLLSVTIYYYY